METGINNIVQGGVVFTNDIPVELHRVEYLNTYVDENGIKKIVFEYQGQQYENTIVEAPTFIPFE